MTLEDTIPLMTSDDYIDRLRAEYFQLKIRTQRLDLAIQSGNFPPAITLVMKGQRNHMINYMSMLVYRAWLEGITLED